jgi:DNA-binding transcriptional regulator YhcF (GntR family)
MATALSIEILFDAAIKIQLLHEKSIQISFTETGMFIKFPTTRKLAEFLDVPHYYVLPYFAIMEQENLVTRAERVGIATTREGTVKFLGMIENHYRKDAENLMGTALFNEILSGTE